MLSVSFLGPDFTFSQSSSGPQVQLREDPLSGSSHVCMRAYTHTTHAQLPTHLCTHTHTHTHTHTQSCPAPHVHVECMTLQHLEQFIEHSCVFIGARE